MSKFSDLFSSLPRKTLVVVVLVANYLFFFGMPDLHDFYAPPVQFTVPQGLQGKLVVSVSSTVRSSRDSGVFRVSLDDTAKDSIQQKLKWRSHVAFDSTGTSFASCSVRQEQVEGNWKQVGSLFVTDQTGAETEIAEGIWGLPIWSPDGEWIVLTHFETQPPALIKSTTWKIKRDGSSKEKLMLPRGDSAQDFYVDGKWILASKNAEQFYNSGEQKYLYNLADQSRISVPQLKDSGQARFSPDGTQLIYIQLNYQEIRSSICVRSFELNDREVVLGEPRVLYTATNGQADFRCSRDGKNVAIAFNDIRLGNQRKMIESGHLFIVNLADGTKHEINVTHAGWLTVDDFR